MKNYNTIKQYQIGGSVSSSLADILNRSFISSGVQGASSALNRGIKGARKAKRYMDVLGKLGSYGGAALGSLAATALAPFTGGTSLLYGSAIGKGVGSFLGRGAGELIGGKVAGDYETGDSPTGFLQSDFKTLKDYTGSLDEGRLGRMAGSGLSTAAFAAASDIGKKGFEEMSENLGYKAKGAIGRFKAGRYTDPVTEDYGATFNDASGMYGDADLSMSDMRDLLSEQSSPSDISYYKSLQGSDLLGAENELQTALQEQSDAESLLEKALDYNRRQENLDFRGPEIGGSSFAPADLLKQSASDYYQEPEEPIGYLQKLMNLRGPSTASGGFYSNQMNQGGMVKKYKGGGLINMNPYARRIL